MSAGSRQKLVVRAINTFFFVGLAPRMPGTFGTLAAVPLAWGLNSLLPAEGVAAVVFVLFLLGTLTAHLQTLDQQTDDPGEIVIDEVVGFLVASLALPLDAALYGLAFALFRILDIVKPPPIGFIDRKIKGGLGVMLDDVLAGLIAQAAVLGALTMGWV